jgi:uncharacterized protein (TIGR03086 family)
VIRDITPDRLDAPTPCAGWSVRDLIQHMLFYGPMLQAAARKEQAAPGQWSDDWQAGLEDQIDRLVTAWESPAAWQGTTSLGSPDPMPAHMIGGMVLGEVVVHGWDLARATGAQPSWDEDLLAFVHEEVAKTASLGREMDVYGPEVPVAADAPALHRMLALTGRDPGAAGPLDGPK